MKYEDIMELLDKGFTAEYIMNMGDDPESAPDPEEQEETPAEKNDGVVTVEMLNNVVSSFTDKMDSVVKELQAANIMNSRQRNEDKDNMTAEDMLATVILPPGVNNKEV